MLNDIQQAYGDWLTGFLWSHFLHLSFDKSVSVEAARRYFLAYIRRLERLTGRAIPWFLSIEGGSGWGEVHIHALVYAPNLLVEDLDDAWHAGHTAVRLYDPTKGGRYYVCKHIADGPVEYDVSDAPPVLRSEAA